MIDEPVEWLLAFYLDETMLIHGVDTIEIGTHREVRVPISHILNRTIRLEAEALLLVHNHPGGTSRPSKADIAVTRKLAIACEALQLTLLDHMIVARDGMRRIMYDLGATRFVPGQGFVDDPPNTPISSG